MCIPQPLHRTLKKKKKVGLAQCLPVQYWVNAAGKEQKYHFNGIMKESSSWPGKIYTAVKANQGVWRYHLEIETVLLKNLPSHRNLLFSKKWPKGSAQCGLLIWESTKCTLVFLLLSPKSNAFLYSSIFSYILLLKANQKVATALPVGVSHFLWFPFLSSTPLDHLFALACETLRDELCF